MTAYTAVTAKAGEKVLDVLSTTQQAVVSAVGSVSQMIGGVIPDLPQLPIAGFVPTPKELVDQYFSLAERFVRAQRQYATDLVKAIEPVSGKIIPNGLKARKTAAKAPQA